MLRPVALLPFWSLVVLSALPAGMAAAQNASQKTPLEAATVSEFVASCDRDAFQCEFIMRQAVLNNINTRNATSICIKDAHPRKPVIAWLQAHPETHKMATEDGLYTAYKDLYRCP